jgi:hypothetical protein
MRDVIRQPFDTFVMHSSGSSSSSSINPKTQVSIQLPFGVGCVYKGLELVRRSGILRNTGPARKVETINFLGPSSAGQKFVISTANMAVSAAPNCPDCYCIDFTNSTRISKSVHCFATAGSI